MTEHLEIIGKPFDHYYRDNNKRYARNIWDMIGFQRKLYLGAGNSSNSGPSVSPGRAPIISYDPESGLFETSFITNEEQVDTFYLFDNILYVPGHDPKESWELGNVYMTQDGTNWQKKRTIPGAIHTYCLASHNNKIFAGLGTKRGGEVAISSDQGESWAIDPLDRIGRIYDFLKVGEHLYAVGPLVAQQAMPEQTQQAVIPIKEVFASTATGTFVHREDLTSNELFPNTALQQGKALKITRAQPVGGKTAYLGSYVHNDHQAIPFGLYIAHSLERNAVNVARIDLPGAATPRDIYRDGERVYVLAKTEGEGNSEVIVLHSDNLTDWEEMFYFEATCSVRSFAYLQGIFYFACGGEVLDTESWTFAELGDEIGTVYALRYPAPE